ncbi:receptor-interacting serine/threonine-protein kinase 3 isoform X1 [Alligator mississippiensis]|uniref:Receptor-interacting serine/threonine-protein kinase 3 n=2 Tax=Alligator mississippiensis TaxID=8496 RepID=A0A151PGW4_ALLMI|nr:receptor-interacting serine/threonine-protein kinase 3 isoform X1 [Alligator mississippiensis]KYO48243.1 receptor-interacting serine/threonine-protein kinase 3 [Alligator mississippiensis]
MANGSEFQERIPYEDLKEDMKFIGHGGFGTVYSATHKRWHIRVAIKEMRQDSPYSHEELLAEARAMDRARFLYVLRLFGLCELKTQASRDPNSQLGIVMEYMENGSLARLQEKIQHVPWALRFQFLHQVALGMNYLHGLKPPLLHLDLKPSNVLLDENLTVRLADFGLSKFKQGTTKLTAARSEEGSDHGGTLEYMPPEALDDINYKPTQATDIYSYAILTWSVLTGEEPYPDVHPKWKSFLFRLHIPKGERPDVTKLDTITDVAGLEDMKQLMKSCWHQECSQRPTFQDCSDKTKKIFSYHNAHTTQAVRMVQDMLKKSGSPTLNPGCPAPAASYSGKDYQTSEHVGAASAPESSGLHDSLLPAASLGISEKFQSLHLEEPPSRENEATPPGFEEERMLKRGQRGCATLSQQTGGLNNGGLGSQRKTHTQMKPPDYPERPLSNPNLPQTQLPTQWPCYPGVMYSNSHQLPVYSGKPIFISGTNTGIQIGNNNYMKVTKKLQKNPKKK